MEKDNARPSTSGKPLEPDFLFYPEMHMNQGTTLKGSANASKISMTPETFEKIYFNPMSPTTSGLRKTFGNPTPVGLLGTLLALTPLSCDLIGWRGTSGSGAAGVGAYLFFGGLLQIIGGLLEFFLGNTFSFVVFMSFGAFWLAFGVTLQPSYGAFSAYAPPNATSPAEGLVTEAFNASFAFFLLFMGVLCIIFLICSLRTNIVFVVIFSSLTVGFGLVTGQHFQLAVNNTDLAAGLQVAGGGAFLLASAAVWWIFFSIMLEILDFPFKIPVGDLSGIIRGASVRAQEDSWA